MFNITNRTARARYQRQTILLYENLARKQSIVFRKTLNRQALGAAKAYANGIDDINFEIDKYYQRMLTEMINYYTRIGRIFSQKAFDASEKLEKNMNDEFWRSFNIFIQTKTAQKVVGITNTTKGLIAKIIQDGASEGLSRNKIASEIRKKSSIANPFRAGVISRTETHSASTKATDDAIKSTRLTAIREWVSGLTERTRISHFEADGQEQPMDGEFIVGGEALSYPGDPKGSAENVIECKCVLLYHTV